MGKEFRSKKPGSQDAQASSRLPSKANSGEAGRGSEKRGTWTDDFGRICYGDECVTLAIDEARREIVVSVKPDAVCDTTPVIEAIRKTLGAGARTVYEVESELREQKPK